MRNIKEFYNYVYCDPRKPTPYKIHGVDIILPAKPFYVGKGKGNRMNAHLSECNLSDDACNVFKKSIIKKINKIGLSPIIRVISSNLTNDEANAQERFLVKMIGRRDKKRGSLVNLTDGGDGTLGFTLSDESINKMRETKKRKFKNGEIEVWNKGLKGTYSEEYRKKISEGKKGLAFSKEERLKRKTSCTINVKVYQYDLEGNFIREFFSKEDVRKYFGVASVTGINRVVNGERPSFKGFLWSFEKLNNVTPYKDRLKPIFGYKHSKETLNKISKANKIPFPVYKYDLNGIFLDEYPNQKIARDNNKGSSGICRALKSDIPKSGNFLWSKEKHDKIDSYQTFLFTNVKK